MIKDIAALLTAFREREVEAIQRSGITHAPTIGAQYEGVSANVLKMMLPPDLGLQVVSGFVEGVNGTLSGQIDGMLVRGTGTPIPSVQGSFKWPIRDVLATIEVKKTLFGADLSDAHSQLQGVMDLFWEYAATIKPADGIDITAPRYVYSQILGEPAPYGKHWETIAFEKGALHRMLLDDHVAPVRIILGYGGYKTEETLRQGFLKFLQANNAKPGYAGSSLPSLIICGQNSLIKTNGQPFYFKPWRGRYLCYASSSHSPLLWLLNIILTRISHYYEAPRWYGRDLSIDRFQPLLWGKAIDTGNQQGWKYWEDSASEADRDQVQTFTTEEWQPVGISQNQAVLLGVIGNDGLGRAELNASMEAIGLREQETIGLVDDLNEKRLVGWDGDTLVLLTQRCTTAFTPNDGIVAHDMVDERFEEWLSRPERWNKPTG